MTRAEFIGRTTAKGGFKEGWEQQATAWWLPPQRGNPGKVSLTLKNYDERGTERETQSYRTERGQKAAELMCLTVRMFMRLAAHNGVDRDRILQAVKYNIESAVSGELNHIPKQQKLEAEAAP